MKLRSKIPTRQEVLSVFSFIVFVVFSWTIFRLLFQIPSWLLSHTKSGILFLAAYVFAFALIESLLVLLFVLLVNLVFPRYLFRDWFIPQGCLLVLNSAAWALLVQHRRDILSTMDLLPVIAWICLYLLSVTIVVFVASKIMSRYDQVKLVFVMITDRMVVFTYLYIPLSLVSLAIVLVRNLV